MIETMTQWLLCAAGVCAVADAVRRASAWHGPRLGAVLINAAYAMVGCAIAGAPMVPRETWPTLLAMQGLTAAGVWIVTRGRA